MGGEPQDLGRTLYDLGDDGVLDQLEGIDQNLFDVITDIMDEKREDWKDFQDEQADADEDRRGKRVSAQPAACVVGCGLRSQGCLPATEPGDKP